MKGIVYTEIENFDVIKVIETEKHITNNDEVLKLYPGTALLHSS